MLGTELPHVVQARAEGPEASSPGQHPGYKRKINLFSRTHKRNPLKTCIKEKYCLFLQQIKRKNDGKGKYRLISSPS